MVLWESAAFAASSKWWPKHGPQAVHHVFDYGPWTIAGFGIPQSTWTEGGGIIIHQDAEHHKALQNPRGTHAMLLPYYLGQVLSAPEGSFPFNETLTLYLSGGTVTASQIREAKRRVCPKVCNRLASTELGPVAITPIDDSQDHRWQAVLPGRGVEIVDEQDCAVPLGQIGQLRVSVGSGPAEYFNDPVATAKFFRHGYFYPGDLAMARSDGRIALQGRTTEIINVDGSKVAPGPIEDIVREKHSLSDVCLLSAQNSHGEEQVYAVVETAVPLSPQVLEQIANTFNDIRLTVLTVAKLPRTATGKIIRAEVQAGLFAAQNQSLLATEQPASRSAALAE